MPPGGAARLLRRPGEVEPGRLHPPAAAAAAGRGRVMCLGATTAAASARIPCAVYPNRHRIKFVELPKWLVRELSQRLTKPTQRSSSNKPINKMPLRILLDDDNIVLQQVI